MMSYHKINVHVLCSLKCLRLVAYISGTMVCTVLFGSMIWRYGFNSNMTPDFVPYIYDQMTERPSSLQQIKKMLFYECMVQSTDNCWNICTYNSIVHLPFSSLSLGYKDTCYHTLHKSMENLIVILDLLLFRENTRFIETHTRMIIWKGQGFKRILIYFYHYTLESCSILEGKGPGDLASITSNIFK